MLQDQDSMMETWRSSQETSSLNGRRGQLLQKVKRVEKYIFRQKVFYVYKRSRE